MAVKDPEILKTPEQILEEFSASHGFILRVFLVFMQCLELLSICILFIVCILVSLFDLLFLCIPSKWQSKFEKLSQFLKVGEYQSIIVSKIKNSALKKLIYGGVALGAIGAIGYPMYKSQQTCRVELNKTIQKMNVEINEWQRKYNEELEKNKVIQDKFAENDKKNAERDKKDAERDKKDAERDKAIQEILKKNGLTLNQTLEKHHSELSQIRDFMMGKIYMS